MRVVFGTCSAAAVFMASIVVAFGVAAWRVSKGGRLAK